MEMTALGLAEILAGRAYPGRGVLGFRTASGDLCLGYFLTGRSEASRDRELTTEPGGDVVVRGRGSDASTDVLRHYAAVARRGETLVIGNGDQVVPLSESLAAGVEPLAAFSAYQFEPDPPIFTPRIWLVTRTTDRPELLFGAAVRNARGTDEADHVAWAVAGLQPGDGVLLTTYEGTAAEVTTSRAPVDFAFSADGPQSLLDGLWDLLDPALRVAALVLDPRDPETSLLTAHRV